MIQFNILTGRNNIVPDILKAEPERKKLAKRQELSQKDNTHTHIEIRGFIEQKRRNTYVWIVRWAFIHFWVMRL